MMFYDLILQGHEATEETATELALCGAALAESEVLEQDIQCLRHVDTVNGIDIWYDYGADYYCFSPDGDE